MSFLQPLLLWALPLVALPILIHLINQWRYQTKQWAAMMFLLQANRMNRGFARIRQWLILAMRTFAIAGLIFAISRPLASGFWSMLGGARADTTLVLMDRSPSMGWQGDGGESKIQAGRRQLADALKTLGSEHWVCIDSSTAVPVEYKDLDAMVDSSSFSLSSATTSVSLSLQRALEYLQVNKPGAADIWICSDLQAGDWNAESGEWSLIRSGFTTLPQNVRFHLLAYPDLVDENLSIRVTDVHRENVVEGVSTQNYLVLSLQVFSSGTAAQSNRKVPVQLEIEGVRSELSVELNGGAAELREQRIALPPKVESGWGKVSIPADVNNADNDYYFVFDKPPMRRVVVVADDAEAVRPVQIAARIAADGSTARSQIELLSPAQLNSLELEGAALLIWQADLPDAATAGGIDLYLAKGGQVVFFPPASVLRGSASGSEKRQYRGVEWTGWQAHEQTPILVTNWRSDQDLLAATNSGAGLPLGQIEIRGHATLKIEQPLTQLATLDGGDSLLARVPTTRGGLYFCSASTETKQSSLAENGVVLFVVVQRAIEQGQAALRGSLMRTAAIDSAKTTQPTISESSLATGATGAWKQIAGTETLSSEYEIQAGVYQSDAAMFAVNRPLTEDQFTQLSDEKIASLFAGLQMDRVDQQAGKLGGIIREIWRQFLILMVVALIAEAVLCIPRRAVRTNLAFGAK
jgi:Aerotolerance regulator N-terminal